MKAFKTIAVILLFSVFVGSCSESDPNPTTIIDIAEANGAKVFAAAARQSGADLKLREAGPFTLIAPSDQGLKTIYGFDQTNLSTQNNDYLKRIVLAHVILKKFKKEEFENGYIDDLNGNLMFVFPKFNVIGGCAIGAQNNLEASNGIVHIQDCAVSLVPDLLQVFNAVSEFSHFRELINRFPDIRETLAKGNLTTIVVPNNDAFKTYFTAEKISSIADIPSDVGRRILLYHIVPDKRFSSYDWEPNGLTVSTALSTDKKLVFARSATVLDGYEVNGALLRGSNIQATRSFVHTIGRVLVP